MPVDFSPDRLRLAALIAAPVGAVGSVALMLLAGKNPPIFLLLLFVLWVLGPFIVLILALMVSKRWSVLTRKTLYVMMLFLTTASLAIYGYFVMWRPQPTPTAVFVILPLASVLIAIMTIATAVLISRRQMSRTT